MSETTFAEDLAPILNENLDGWSRANALRFLKASPEEVIAEIRIGPQHLQPYGLVHGGVHAGLIETLASVGAALQVLPQGRSAVGLENTTSFLRAVRQGTLCGTARPLTRGKTTQVWQVEVKDERGRLVSIGRVRLLCPEADTPIAGAPTRLRPGGD